MNASDFCRAVAAVMPGKPSASRTSAMVQMASRLKLDFADHVLTQRAADETAKVLTGFPTYHEFVDAVRRGIEADDTVPQHVPQGGGIWHMKWLEFVAKADNPEHELLRLSIAQAYAERETWLELLRLYHNHIQSQRPHWLPFDHTTRAKPRIPSLQKLNRAAPPPAGPRVATRPVSVEDGPKPRLLEPELLAEWREANGIFPIQVGALPEQKPETEEVPF